MKSNFFSAVWLSATALVMVIVPNSICLRRIRPGDRGIVDLVVFLSHLQEQFELGGTTAYAFTNLSAQIIGLRSGELFLVRKCSPATGRSW
jgi:hypothetical protein